MSRTTSLCLQAIAVLVALSTRPSHAGTSDLSSLATDFHRDGFAVVKGFASTAECDGMMRQMDHIIDLWDPAAGKASVFRTDKAQETAQGSDDYFLSSADKIHFFLEPGATDESSPDGIKEGFTKHRALNKVGHGLHLLDPVFKAYAESPKLGALVRALGWSRHAVVPQSMFIFKQPGVGGEVPPHQDSTFLFTTPRQTCLGLWLALEDANEENGMLWARPGSHQEPVQKHFARNPRYFHGGNKSEPMMVFVEQPNAPSSSSSSSSMSAKEEEEEEKSPGAEEQHHPRSSGDDGEKEGGGAAAAPPISRFEELARAGFKPLPVRKGDLVAIHGQVDHMSLPNTSPKSRHTFQLHAIEGPGAGVTWSPLNWLQYSNEVGAQLPLSPAGSTSSSSGSEANNTAPQRHPGFPTFHVPDDDPRAGVVASSEL